MEELTSLRCSSNMLDNINKNPLSMRKTDGTHKVSGREMVKQTEWSYELQCSIVNLNCTSTITPKKHESISCKVGTMDEKFTMLLNHV